MTKVRGKRSGYAGTRVGLFNVSSSSNVINRSLLLMNASILLIRMRAMHEDHRIGPFLRRHHFCGGGMGLPFGLDGYGDDRA